MKKIRRTRITVRKREILVVGNSRMAADPDSAETHVCPLCHSVLHSELKAPEGCESGLAGVDRKLLMGKIEG